MSLELALPEMGDRVREIVTGREGVITGVCEYLWGCKQFLVYVDDEVDKEGDPKSTWYDVGRLAVTDRGFVEPIAYKTEGMMFTGPDREAPRR